MFKRIFSVTHSKVFFSRILLCSSLSLLIVGCACTDNRKPEAGNKKKGDNDQVALLSEYKTVQVPVTKAVAEVSALSDQPLEGKIVFQKVADGIRVVGDVKGLKPGKHGFHVHEFGDCGGHEGAAAGGHFNPTKSKHGGPDSAERHVGDLGNLEADGAGHAHYDRVDRHITFEGDHSILGRSIIIHADPDDFTTQPTGNSGARIGCGIVESAMENQ